MKLRNTGIFMAMLFCAACLTGCGEGESDSSAADSANSAAESSAETEAAQETTEMTPGKHHIVIESAEVSLADLKAQDYTVPIMVTLDKNAGIIYSEWGAWVDERCTFTADNQVMGLAFQTYYSINEEKNFIWTAWASAGTENAYSGWMILLNIVLPEDAAPGDTYTIEYADMSLADKPHIWKSSSTDWAENGDVTWKNGVITVTE